MKPLFITGGNGFVGKNLCDYLKSKNRPFVAGVRSNPQLSQVAYGDLGSEIQWDSLLQGCECVVHTAARVHIMKDSSADPIKEFRKLNVDATFRLAQQAKLCGVQKFIFISTVKVNGEKTSDSPFKADDRPSPEDAYAVSKHEAEQALLTLHQPGVFDVVIIRPPLIYGQGVKANFNSLLKLSTWPLPLPFGLVNNKRSLISVLNLCDLILHSINSKKVNGHILMAADEHPYSLKDLVVQLAWLKEKKPLLIPIPVSWMLATARFLKLSHLTDRLFGNLEVDISKTKELLNWTPPYTIESTFKS